MASSAENPIRIKEQSWDKAEMDFYNLQTNLINK